MTRSDLEMKHSEAGDLEKDLASQRFTCILLDFDYTLFLDNSTERFLDGLRPRILAFLICAFSDWLLQVLAWFRLCSYPVHRDFLRVSLSLLFMPWSLFLWRHQSKKFARESMNSWLLDRLPADREILVISFGFAPLIRPLLDHAGLQDFHLIASEPGSGSGNLRRKGKGVALKEHLPEDRREETLFITDSEDDAELLETMPHGRLIEWTEHSDPAFRKLYLPFRYTVEGKYAGSRYFTYQILLEDLALLFFAYTLSWPVAGTLILLFFSLYCIYEVGYYENDHKGAQSEKHARVSAEAAAFPPLPPLRPWLWAVGSALLGWTFLSLMIAPLSPESVKGLRAAVGLWLCLLIFLRSIFWVFNRLKPVFRVPLFPLLHLFKVFPYAICIPLHLPGVILLFAQIISMTANYAAYRWCPTPRRLNRQAWRLILFLLLAAAGFALYPERMASPFPGWWVLVLSWGGIRALEHARHKNIVRIVGELLFPALRKE
jgi:hypothetical protein